LGPESFADGTGASPQKDKVNSEVYVKYMFYDLAFNVRPTEITEFFELQQLALLEENIAVRAHNYREIERVVASNPVFPLITVTSNQSHLSRCRSLFKSQEFFHKYITAFAGAGIEVRPMIAGNIQLQPFYKKYVANTKCRLHSQLWRLLRELSGTYARRSRCLHELLAALIPLFGATSFASLPGSHSWQ
jgi:hypothetical protein